MSPIFGFGQLTKLACRAPLQGDDSPASLQQTVSPTVRWGVASSPGQRPHMEDAHLGISSLALPEGSQHDYDSSFFGVSVKCPFTCCRLGCDALILTKKVSLNCRSCSDEVSCRCLMVMAAWKLPTLQETTCSSCCSGMSTSIRNLP